MKIKIHVICRCTDVCVIWHICVYDTSVYMTHLCIWHICVYDTSVYMTHLCIWHICVYDTSVYMTHLCIWHICVYDTSVCHFQQWNTTCSSAVIFNIETFLPWFCHSTCSTLKYFYFFLPYNTEIFLLLFCYSILKYFCLHFILFMLTLSGCFTMVTLGLHLCLQSHFQRWDISAT